MSSSVVSNTNITSAPVKAAKKSKGLSFEDKRKRMMDYFMGKRDFFQLKELERSLPKEKGIVSQSVKEVLQSLVDDRLVQQEKIGTSNYFWSFPSQALQSRRNKIDLLQKEIASLTDQRREIDGKVAIASNERSDPDRKGTLERLHVLRTEGSILKGELELEKEMDPELFEKKKGELQRLKEDVEVCTDNIFSIQGYCLSNFSISRSAFLEQFGLSDDFDYLS